jgi:peptidoglycan hydrolase-like protein with peptidoglycan-binding domain
MELDSLAVTESESVPGAGKCDANYIQDLSAILINKPDTEETINKDRSGNVYKFKRTLKLTDPMMHGDDVNLLQKRLQIPVDGIFGPKTKRAVMIWQRVHDEKGNVVPPGKGLVVDSIVGPKTWNALKVTSINESAIY